MSQCRKMYCKCTQVVKCTKLARQDLFINSSESHHSEELCCILQAGDVDAGSLSALSSLLNNTSNIEMVEYLMAAMWILLRNPHNRKILSTSFSSNAANTMTRDIHSKLQDAINIYSAQDALDSSPNMDSQDPLADQTAEGNDSNIKPQTSACSKPENLESDATNCGKSREGKHINDEENPVSSTNNPEHGNEDNLSKGNEQTPPSAESNLEAEEKDPDSIVECEENTDNDWGLETLIRVGENWLPRILQLNVSCDDSDAPLLKLFEFLSASMCLFLVGDNEDPAPTSVALFEYGCLSRTKRCNTVWILGMI